MADSIDVVLGWTFIAILLGVPWIPMYRKLGIPIWQVVLPVRGLRLARRVGMSNTEYFFFGSYKIYMWDAVLARFGIANRVVSSGMAVGLRFAIVPFIGLSRRPYRGPSDRSGWENASIFEPTTRESRIAAARSADAG